jgi:hypothetical protein
MQEGLLPMPSKNNRHTKREATQGSRRNPRDLDDCASGLCRHLRYMLLRVWGRQEHIPLPVPGLNQ